MENEPIKEKVEDRSAENMVTLYFAGFGAIVGLLVGIFSSRALGSPLIDAWGGFFVAVIFMYISIKIVPEVFDFKEKPIKDSSVSGLFKMGVLPFFLIMLIVWTTVYTLAM